MIKERFNFWANRDTEVTLGHGGNIIRMCIEAGLKIVHNEARLGLGDSIDAKKIIKFRQWKHGEAHPDGAGFTNALE